MEWYNIYYVISLNSLLVSSSCSFPGWSEDRRTSNTNGKSIFSRQYSSCYENNCVRLLLVVPDVCLEIADYDLYMHPLTPIKGCDLYLLKVDILSLSHHHPLHTTQFQHLEFTFSIELHKTIHPNSCCIQNMYMYHHPPQTIMVSVTWKSFHCAHFHWKKQLSKLAE